ncbi:endonuclease [Port-miou virus]|uniref:Endonuclease n=1 Tax=Port-miou virus TaxID=1733873 RepID=A0A0N9PYS2_9VIRU|nr:endonuclease [Port-miou virus]
MASCNAKKGRNRLCAEEECEYCFKRSFASHKNAEFWSTERNEKTPREVTKNSGRKVWFDCSVCKHSFDTTPGKVSNRGDFCPYCSSNRMCFSDDCGFCFEKSFASHEKAEFWSFEKNEVKPREIFRNANKKYWFECGSCKHSFDVSPNNVVGGKFCPYCPNNKLCTSADCEICFKKSFANHKKAKFWSPKNQQSPREVFRSAKNKYLFVCKRNHEFQIALYSISAGQWCAKCKNKTETKLLSFLEKHFGEVVHQFKVSWCKNPDTNKFMPFDFCVGKTIIELDGPQHYEQVRNWKTPEVTQKNDRYKEDCAAKNGYSVLRILQEDVWEDKIDWRHLLLENIRDYDEPTIKNLWQGIPLGEK